MGLVSGALTAGGLIGSKLLGNSAQKAAMKQTPQEIAAYGGASRGADASMGIGDTAAKQGTQLYGMGAPAVGQALQYYSTLTGGNRAQMQEAVAPEAEQITDVYKGAERGLERSGVRGASRDQASAELSRQKAGQIAGLIGGVRGNAAQTLAGIGGSTLSQASGANATAAGAYGGAGNIYQGLIGGEAQRRSAGVAASDSASAGVGALVADLLKSYGSKGGK